MLTIFARLATTGLPIPTFTRPKAVGVSWSRTIRKDTIYLVRLGCLYNIHGFGNLRDRILLNNINTSLLPVGGLNHRKPHTYLVWTGISRFAFGFSCPILVSVVLASVCRHIRFIPTKFPCTRFNTFISNNGDPMI